MLKRVTAGVRATLRDGGQLPAEFTRPEVAAVLHAAFAQAPPTTRP